MHGRGHLSVLVPVNVDSLEDGRAAQIEALDAGSVPAAVETRLGQARLQSRVDVHRPLTILGNLGRHLPSRTLPHFTTGCSSGEPNVQRGS